MSLRVKLHVQCLLTFFPVFHGVTEVGLSHLPDREDYSNQAIGRQRLSVVDMGCIRSPSTVSGNKTPQVRLLSYSQELVSLLSAEWKGKRDASVWSSGGQLTPQMPEANVRPALALHTALTS
jgi:hypothetical protein